MNNKGEIKEGEIQDLFLLWSFARAFEVMRRVVSKNKCEWGKDA